MLRRIANAKVSDGFAYVLIFSLFAFVLVMLYAKQPDLAHNDPESIEMRERIASGMTKAAVAERQKKIDANVHLAIQAEKFEALDKLLKDPANKNKLDESGNTPLHTAISKPSQQAVAALIKAGANVDSTDGLGNTPLHQAVSKSSMAIIDLLIKAGANVDKIDANGNTPLMVALNTNGKDDLLKMLVSANPDAGIKNDRGQTAYSIALRGRNPEKIFLLPPPADDSYFNQGLLRALQRGNTELAVRFLDGGANPYTQDKEMYNEALMAGLRKHPRELVKRLLDLSQSQIDSKLIAIDMKSGDPLRASIQRGYFDIAQTILDSGVTLEHPSYLSGQFNNVLNLKKRPDREQGVRFLVDNGVDLTIDKAHRKSYLMRAAEQGRQHVVKTLVEFGANVNHFSRMQTPLSLAAKGKTFGHKISAATLRQHGAIEDPLVALKQQNGIREETDCEVGSQIPVQDLAAIENFKPRKRNSKSKGKTGLPTSTCFYWVLSCAKEETDIDSCMRSAPQCKPGEDEQICCPDRCFSRYQEARCAGVNPERAFVWLFKEDSAACKL